MKLPSTKLPAIAALVALVVFASSTVASAATFKEEYAAGVAAYKAADYEGALAHFEAAYALEKVPLCLFGMAQALRKLEHFDRALESYELFLAAKPKPELAAEVAGYMTEMRAAKKSVDEIATARKLAAAGELTAAAAAYERAWSLRPSGELLCTIGETHDRAGARPKAVEFYERCLASDAPEPSKAAARAALAALGVAPSATVAPGPAISSAALEPPPAPPAAKRSRLPLFIAAGAGAAVLVAGAVILGVVLGAKARRPPPAALGFRVVEL